MFLKRIVIVAALLLVATSAMAAQFRAADLVYLPALARTAGGGGSFFNTDVWISNVSQERVIVSVAYLPTGGGDNSNFTLVNLPVLLPGERREITNFAQAAFGLEQANGWALFFACREGGNCADCEANPADCELITVEARIYNQTPNGTFGQLFPGIPWYSFVSMNAADLGLDSVFIAGIRNTGSIGVEGFRTNIGLVNASQFSTTTLRLRLFTSTGTPVGADATVTLGPLGHLQQNVATLFPGFTGTGAYVVIDQIAASPVPGVTDGNPGFLAYGSLVDNRTADPTTLEALFEEELEYTCVFGSKPLRRPAKRP